MSLQGLMPNTTIGNGSISWRNGTVVAMNATVTVYPDFQMTVEDSLAQKIAAWIRVYFSPFLLFAAVLGNLTSFAVFSTPPYRHSLTAMLYRILAVADTLAVVVQDGFNVFANLVSGKSLMTYNNASCKLLVPLHIWSRAFAAWVLVTIGLERFIGILFPHRAQVINTKKRFAWITVAVATGLAAFYTPLFITIERALLFNYCKLTADLNRLKGYFTIFDEMSLLLTCLLPFVFIITFNIAIVSVLVKRRTALTSSRDNDSQTNSAVAMLISVSVAFVILTLPFGVYLILQKYYIRIGDMESYRKTIILYGFASICDSTNHSINVVLYCLTGRKFRQCLRKMVCCACLRTGFDGKGSQTTSQSTQDFRLDQSSSINSVTQAT